MIEGTLVINLDPPYIGFFPNRQSQPMLCPEADSWSYCTQQQIKELLIDLDVIQANQHWPPRECILRLPIALPKVKLAKHGLTKPHSIEIATIAKPRPVRRIS